MSTPAYTGSDKELADLVDALADSIDEQWRKGDNPEVLDVSEFLAWRDAAVARFLAEAGAVHPKVHTPTRVQQWLGEHGWQAAAPVDPQRLTSPWVHPTGYQAWVPLHPKTTVDYSARVHEVVARGAQFAGVPFERALLEIALLPDEVAW